LNAADSAKQEQAVKAQVNDIFEKGFNPASMATYYNNGSRYMSLAGPGAASNPSSLPGREWSGQRILSRDPETKSEQWNPAPRPVDAYIPNCKMNRCVRGKSRFFKQYNKIFGAYQMVLEYEQKVLQGRRFDYVIRCRPDLLWLGVTPSLFTLSLVDKIVIDEATLVVPKGINFPAGGAFNDHIGICRSMECRTGYFDNTWVRYETCEHHPSGTTLPTGGDCGESFLASTVLKGKAPPIKVVKKVPLEYVFMRPCLGAGVAQLKPCSRLGTVKGNVQKCREIKTEICRNSGTAIRRKLIEGDSDGDGDSEWSAAEIWNNER